MNNSTKKHPNLFNRFSEATSILIGSSPVFTLACAIILIWAISGPFFHFSNYWQLIMNTGTSVLTFLIVFLIQNTQNRINKITQLKLDELIHACDKAKNTTINLEDLTDKQLKLLEEQYKTIAKKK